MRIGFDCDGVLSLTPFGRFAVHAPQPVAPLPDDWERAYERPVHTGSLRLAMEYARFVWRPAPQRVAAILSGLAKHHQLHVVTGRSAQGMSVLQRWLRRHRIEACFASIHMSPEGLSSPQHKLAAARLLQLDAHIDDDPRTAFYLAAETDMQIYLLDHANARGETPLPRTITLVTSLDDFAARLTAAADVARETSP